MTLGPNRLALANSRFVLDRSHYICWRSSVASIALRPATNNSAQPAYKLNRANGRVESVNGVFSFLLSLLPLTTSYKLAEPVSKVYSREGVYNLTVTCEQSGLSAWRKVQVDECNLKFTVTGLKRASVTIE